MSDRKKILDDPGDYTSEQLLSAIQNNVVTEEELFSIPDEKFSKVAKVALRQEVEKHEHAKEMSDWNKIVNHLTTENLRDFISKYSDGVMLQTARLKLEEICWKNLSKKRPSKEEVEAFLKEFPTGEHNKQAEALLDGVMFGYTVAERILEKEREIKNNNLINEKDREFLAYLIEELNRGKITPDDILQMLYYDHNALNSKIVYGLVHENIFSRIELVQKSQIDDKFIKFMERNPPSFILDSGVRLPEPKGELSQIEDGFTEFYFWGIPSSGKTCALAGILSAANSGHVCTDFSPMTNSQGYDYMSTLSEFFRRGEVRELPAATSVTDTYEMKFELLGRYERKKKNGNVEYDNKYYRCAAIDLAGELFCCIHEDLAGVELLEDKKKALANLKKILVENKSKNRKIHFFVIEYGAENRLYKGRTQDVYLRSCMRYIEENGIFDKNTDRIYIMVTKSDKFNVTETTLETDILRQYIEDNYLGFYKNLKRLCQKYDINDGEPGLMAYNIGDVCFQDYCRFHPGKSESVVYSCFLDTVYGYNIGCWGKIKKYLGL